MPSESVDGRLRKRLEGLITHVSCYKLLAVVSEAPQWKYWDGDPEQPYRGAITLHASRPEIDAAYDELEAGLPVRKPVISFSMPSFADPTLTRPGYHTASVWIYPAPATLRTGSWDDFREEIAEGIIDQITEFAPNFRSSIRHHIFRTPLDIERENGLTDGCIWHVQHAGEHLFWNRPLPELSQYRAPHKGLYLCGAGQHPGGEVSGIPGHNAAQEVLRDLA
jgi:phytoene dehydrogenase-like protein